MVGDQIVLVNRTKKNLSFMVDGRSYTLKPGKNHGFVESQARFAMAQNPLMGTEDYLTLEYQSLVGIEGVNDCSEIPEEVIEAVKEAERFDLASMAPAARKNRVAVAARLPLKGRVASGISANSNAIGE